MFCLQSGDLSALGGTKNRTLVRKKERKTHPCKIASSNTYYASGDLFYYFCFGSVSECMWEVGMEPNRDRKAGQDQVFSFSASNRSEELFKVRVFRTAECDTPPPERPRAAGSPVEALSSYVPLPDFTINNELVPQRFVFKMTLVWVSH